MDYAMKKDLSSSTLWRCIKSKKVLFKLEGGRYFLWDESPTHSASHEDRAALMDHSNGLGDKLKSTMTDLQKAQEEIAELKTLIAYYEERLPKTLES